MTESAERLTEDVAMVVNGQEINVPVTRAHESGACWCGNEHQPGTLRPEFDPDYVVPTRTEDIDRALINAPRQLISDREALVIARRALVHAEQACRYHGRDFGFLDMYQGEPRCECCRQPYRVVAALAAVNAALGA